MFIIVAEKVQHLTSFWCLKLRVSSTFAQMCTARTINLLAVHICLHSCWLNYKIINWRNYISNKHGWCQRGSSCSAAPMPTLATQLTLPLEKFCWGLSALWHTHAKMWLNNRHFNFVQDNTDICDFAFPNIKKQASNILKFWSSLKQNQSSPRHKMLENYMFKVYTALIHMYSIRTCSQCWNFKQLEMKSMST